jgi:RNA polymerase sigma factor (TIGR02999 family)
MTQPETHEVTRLLQAWGQGEDGALEQMIPLVYKELRRIAHRYMADEPKGHTLQTTALINEAYLRLIDSRKVSWQNRAHFFAICAKLMRRILVDFARSRGYQKRGGGAQEITLDEGLMGAQERGRNLLALDDAMETLSEVDDHANRKWLDMARPNADYLDWTPDSKYLYFDTLLEADPALYRVRVSDLNVEPRG